MLGHSLNSVSHVRIRRGSLQLLTGREESYSRLRSFFGVSGGVRTVRCAESTLELLLWCDEVVRDGKESQLETRRNAGLVEDV
jgi:hypothetical protein